MSGAGQDLRPLFDTIVKKVPPPPGQRGRTSADPGRQSRLQRLPRTPSHRRGFNGTLRTGDEVGIAKLNGSVEKNKITKLFSLGGLRRNSSSLL
jgi:GTP-binding protein